MIDKSTIFKPKHQSSNRSINRQARASSFEPSHQPQCQRCQTTIPTLKLISVANGAWSRASSTTTPMNDIRGQAASQRCYVFVCMGHNIGPTARISNTRCSLVDTHSSSPVGRAWSKVRSTMSHPRRDWSAPLATGKHRLRRLLPLVNKRYSSIVTIS